MMKSFKFKTSKEGPGEEDLEKIAEQEQKQFSFETLLSATKDFHPTNKLGEGGFGPVYKGKLDDGREIAVKKLSQSSNQGKKEFMNEAKLLARVQHRNIVNLLGYCALGVEKLLVYEYVANESLDKFLFNFMKRKRRKKEVFDLALTNEFLDYYIMKKHNMMVAHLVFQNLLDWAYKLHRKDRGLEIIDPKLASSAVTEQVKTCIHIGLLCAQGDPRLRPHMRRVVVLLSKKPSNLEEPDRPGVPGSRYRRSRRPGGNVLNCRCCWNIRWI
ncbi:hypothetical protein OIU76_013872 [Salix suchowensis]|nr:hypothetical protein OIU76_013872 [Salix suchowensis]